MKISKCRHPTIMKDMCMECGADLTKVRSEMELSKSKILDISSSLPPQTASVAMVYFISELKVSKEEAESLGRADQKSLLQSRELVLMVDLVQTLIHSMNENVDSNINEVIHFQF